MIFDGVGCRIGERARIGLVGNNGAGKTTLLRVLVGELEPDEGRIELSKGLRVGYLPQDLVELEPVPVLDLLKVRVGIAGLEARLRETELALSAAREGSLELAALLDEHARLERRFDHLGGFGFEAVALKVLRGLGFSRGDGARSCAEFSGGWKMRIAMAALLLSVPDVLLLDEPTNHLDTESMEWLEGWLRSHRGAIVAVSHDRRFLENMTEQTAELEHGRLTLYPCSYDRYLMEKEWARERRERAAEEQKRRVEEIERFVDRFRYKSSKAAQVQSRLKQLEKMEPIVLDGPEKGVRFRIPEAPDSGWEVLGVRGLSKRYGDKCVFEDVGFSVTRGERVALVGVNGAGKSTLLRLLSGVEEPTSGSVRLGHNVRRAFYSQESAQNVNYAHTIWEEARSAPSTLNEVGRRSLLGAFLFSGPDIHKPVSVLSGGEKARLALFKLMLEETNFLILDEPTNHLDRSTKELVQSALLQYGGTLLIVSHDRHFLDALAERVLEVRDGRLYDYPGNYSWFLEKREEALACGGGAAESAGASEVPDAREARRRLAAERERLNRERSRIRKELNPLEKRIEGLELRRDGIDAALSDPAVLADSGRIQELMMERSVLVRDLSEAYERWEELSLRLESVGDAG